MRHIRKTTGDKPTLFHWSSIEIVRPRYSLRGAEAPFYSVRSVSSELACVERTFENSPSEQVGILPASNIRLLSPVYEVA